MNDQKKPTNKALKSVKIDFIYSYYLNGKLYKSINKTFKGTYKKINEVKKFIDIIKNKNNGIAMLFNPETEQIDLKANCITTYKLSNK